jgi:hypothetical protein
VNDPFNVSFSTKVNGTNVDQTVSWSIEVVSNNGFGSANYGIDGDGNLTVQNTGVKFGHTFILVLKVHAKSTQDTSKEATPTGNLNFAFANY